MDEIHLKVLSLGSFVKEQSADGVLGDEKDLDMISELSDLKILKPGCLPVILPLHQRL